MSWRTNRHTGKRFRTLYHGTSRVNAENILREGLNPTSDEFPAHASLTDNEDSAITYALYFRGHRKPRDAAIVKVQLPLGKQLDYISLSPREQLRGISNLLKPGETYFAVHKRIPPEYLSVRKVRKDEL